MKKKIPSSFVILFIIIMIVALFTWFIPSGEYYYKCTNGGDAILYTNPLDGSEINACPINEEASYELDAAQTTGAEVDPSKYTETTDFEYREIEKQPQGILQVLSAPTQGFYEAIDIALFVIVIGGFINIVMKTNSFDLGINSLLKKNKGKEIYLIPILMVLFALGGTTYGMAEETIAFYILIVPVFYRAGFDALTGFMVIMLGAGIGVVASTVNPFATGVASGAAEVSIGDGIVTRTILLIILLVITIAFVMRYAKKVKANPEKSKLYDIKSTYDEAFLKEEPEVKTMSKAHVFVLVLFAIAFIIMILGVIPWSDFGITIFETFNNWINTIPIISGVGNAIPLGSWWFGELTTLFLVFAMVIGFYAKRKKILDGEVVPTFIDGCKDLLDVALIIAVARGVQVIMSSAGMDSTILYYGSQALSGFNEIGFTVITFLLYLPLSFLIPSTSGLATVSIPVIAPLGDQIFNASSGSVMVITAFTAASGIINIITPTSGVVMGGLAISKIPYDRWLRYIVPFLVGITVLIAIYFVILIALGIYV